MKKVCCILVALLLLAVPVGAQTVTRSQASLTTQFSTTCASTSCVTVALGGFSRVGVQVTGTWSGTLTFKCTIDGTNFVATNFVPFASATAASTTTANGAWSTSLSAAACRVEFTTASSGTAVVTLRSIAP